MSKKVWKYTCARCGDLKGLSEEKLVIYDDPSYCSGCMHVTNTEKKRVRI